MTDDTIKGWVIYKNAAHKSPDSHSMRRFLVAEQEALDVSVVFSTTLKSK